MGSAPAEAGPAPGREARFRAALLAHFGANRRPLPWRSDRNEYRVAVSEFMLQQTRAETAASYYKRWLRRFPDWDALARASSDEVVREWQGLGYYARARNLHRAARMVRDEFGGRLPADPRALKALPGVGDYTAAAIASIVHGSPAAAVDGNVRRVLSRLLDVADPAQSQLRREASRLLDPERPGDFNEAMMELGATVCLPRAPRCDACPVAGFCAARAAGTAHRRPAPRRRRSVRKAAFASAVLVDAADRTLLVRRPETGLLAGMWEFPGNEFACSADASPPAGVIASLARRRLHELGVDAAAKAAASPLAPVKHAFTHFRATYHPVVVALPGAAPQNATPRENARLVAVSRDAFEQFALPVAQQKIALALERWLSACNLRKPLPAGSERATSATLDRP